MEVRPIDANALKASFEEDGHLSAYIEEYIDNAPTLDYAPVKRGEFERQPEEYIVGLYVTPIYCKTCDTTYFTMNKDGRRTICCPYCGARMDGKEDK